MPLIEVATVKVRPHPTFHKNGIEAYNCIAHYEHQQEQEVWVSIGAAPTADGAQDDLRTLLEAEGIEAPDFVECLDVDKRRRLIWSAKARAMMNGVALVVVEE